MQLARRGTVGDYMPKWMTTAYAYDLFRTKTLKRQCFGPSLAALCDTSLRQTHGRSGTCPVFDRAELSVQRPITI
jgi:hypothetical protein